MTMTRLRGSGVRFRSDDDLYLGRARRRSAATALTMAVFATLALLACLTVVYGLSLITQYAADLIGARTDAALSMPSPVRRVAEAVLTLVRPS